MTAPCGSWITVNRPTVGISFGGTIDFSAQFFRFCGGGINIVHGDVGSPRRRHTFGHFWNRHNATHVDLAGLDDGVIEVTHRPRLSRPAEKLSVKFFGSCRIGRQQFIPAEHAVFAS
jgi:hypothetical protein